MFRNAEFRLFYSRYTLRNAEFRLCVEKNLEIHKGHIDKQKAEDTKLEAEGLLLNDDEVSKFFRQDNLPLSETNGEVTSQIPDLGEISLEAREYILRLQSRLSSVRKVYFAFMYFIGILGFLSVYISNFFSNITFRFALHCQHFCQFTTVSKSGHLIFRCGMGVNKYHVFKSHYHMTIFPRDGMNLNLGQLDYSFDLH